jgi:hypothetical protein
MNKEIINPNRFEKKWLFKNTLYPEVLLSLYRSKFFFRQQHTSRFINSIYFDTNNLDCINDNLNTYELDSFIIILLEVYFFLLILSIVISYFVSVYITRAISEIAYKMNQTRLDKTNTKIEIKPRSKEIYSLVNSYNKMVEMLDESVEKLSKSNKEQAWREMAKQVAHEIKNPLTPMKLSVQSFQRSFDINNPNVGDKLDEFIQTLIQQIDTMSSIASAFSNFAEMPAQLGEKTNIIQTVKLALEIFNEKHIKFISEFKEIQVNIDRTQMVRIITNLIKNAIQASESIEEPLIQVMIKRRNNNVFIEIKIYIKIHIHISKYNK